MRPILTVALVGALSLPNAASAQAARTASVGPTAQSAAVALRAPSLPDRAPTLMRQESQRNNVALMLIGAATIVIGAIVDDDDASTILIVGGAGIGLIGLYRYIN